MLHAACWKYRTQKKIAIKYILTACFLGNICAKNCRNRTVYVKLTASCKGVTFFRDNVYILLVVCRNGNWSEVAGKNRSGNKVTMGMGWDQSGKEFVGRLSLIHI